MMSNNFSDSASVSPKRGVGVHTHIVIYLLRDFSERDFHRASNASFSPEAQFVPD